MGLRDFFTGKVLKCQYCRAALSFHWDKPEQEPEIKITICPDCYGINLSQKNLSDDQKKAVLAAVNTARDKIFGSMQRIGERPTIDEIETAVQEEISRIG